MKLIFSLIAALVLMACDGASNGGLIEDFNLTNDSSYKLTVTYKVNPSELRASVSSNYDDEGIFFGDKIYTADIVPGDIHRLFRTDIKKHASWHATGPAKPGDFFEYITVEAVLDGSVVANIDTLNFQYINHGATSAVSNPSVNPSYEYHATVTDQDLQLP